MLKLAEHILDSKAAEFDPSTFDDHYEIAVIEMLQQEAGRPAGADGGARRTARQRRQPDGRAEAQPAEGRRRPGGGAPAPAPEKARPQAREPQRAAAARKPAKKARRAG